MGLNATTQINTNTGDLVLKSKANKRVGFEDSAGFVWLDELAKKSSIATAAILSGLSGVEGEIKELSGYYSSGDGGGGTFIFDSTKTGENNGGTVLNGWVRQFSGPANVKWFGAVGDGVTDDTDAIQMCINYIRNALEAGSVYIPAGTYVITESLLLSNAQVNGFVMYGDGTYMESASGKVTKISFAPSVSSSFITTDVILENCIFHSMRIESENSNSLHCFDFYAGGSSLVGTRNCVIRNISIQGFVNGACIKVHRTYNIEIKSVVFFDCKIGVHKLGFTIASKVTKCWFRNYTVAGIYLEGDETFLTVKCVLSENIFELAGSTSTTDLTGIRVTYSQSSVIRDNHFEELRDNSGTVNHYPILLENVTRFANIYDNSFSSGIDCPAYIKILSGASRTFVGPNFYNLFDKILVDNTEDPNNAFKTYYHSPLFGHVEQVTSGVTIDARSNVLEMVYASVGDVSGFSDDFTKDAPVGTMATLYFVNNNVTLIHEDSATTDNYFSLKNGLDWRAQTAASITFRRVRAGYWLETSRVGYYQEVTVNSGPNIAPDSDNVIIAFSSPNNLSGISFAHTQKLPVGFVIKMYFDNDNATIKNEDTGTSVSYFRLLEHADWKPTSGDSIAFRLLNDKTWQETYRSDIPYKFSKFRLSPRDASQGWVEKTLISDTLTWSGEAVIALRPESGITDTLSEITGGTNADILIIMTKSGETINIATGTSLKVPSGGVTLTGAYDTAMFIHNSFRWVLVSVSNNV